VELRLNGERSITIYARQVHCKEDEINTFKKFVGDCIKSEEDGGFGLFESDSICFWSRSMLFRMKHLDAVRKKKQMAGRLGGTATASAKHLLNACSSTRQAIKVKESKVNKGKKEYAPTVHMTPVEYQKLVDLIDEGNAKRCITKLSDYKGASGKRYKDDYRAIRNWVVKQVTGKDPSEWETVKPKEKYTCPECNLDITDQILNTTDRCCHGCGANLTGVQSSTANKMSGEEK